MTTSTTCESCGMPIETGRYCSHCVDADGNLQSFDERFERMVGWQARRHPEQTRDQGGGGHAGVHGHPAGLA
jgi:hypothetical protein